jgi:hypothetical protein
MLRVLSVDEVFESRLRLLDELEDALLEVEDGCEFPRNFELYNMLLHVMRFWKR